MELVRQGTSGPDGPAADASPAAPRGPDRRRPSYRRTLANRSFLFLWLSQLVSQSGDFVFEVALLWMVLELTGSAFAVGLVVAATIVPAVVLGPVLGVYIDRWDRRRTLLATNVAQGVVVAVLSGILLTGGTTLPLVLVVVVILGAGSTVVRTASNAYVPALVDVSDLPPANGLLLVSGSMNQVVGLSVGGVVVALFGVGPPIEYDALTFFAAALLLLAIPHRAAPTSGASNASGPRFRRELAEGWAYIRSNRFMLEILALGLVVNFFANGVFSLFAPYTAFVLHGSAEVYGALGAFVAAGSVVGATAVGRLDTRERAGQFLFGGGLVIGGAILTAGLVVDLPADLAVMLVLGASIAVTNLPMQVLLQAKVPPMLLGRVGSTFMAIIIAVSPFGPLFSGWLAQRWSIEGVFLVSGGIFVAVVALGYLTMAELRNVRY